jgi:hypothetical protein
MQRWTDAEEIELIQSITNKIPLEEIAKKHARNIDSIKLQLQKIIYESIIIDGKDVISISSKLHLAPEEVHKYYKNYKEYLKNNGNKNSNYEIKNSGDRNGDRNSNNEVDQKMKKLERENKFIKLVLENIELHRRLNEQIEKNKIDKNIKDTIKEMRRDQID